jgi:hypothetical protein
VLDPAGALALLAGGYDPEAVGPLSDRPTLVVRLDPGPDLDDLSARLRSVPCVVVGVAADPDGVAAPEGFDVLLTDVDRPPRPWVGGEMGDAGAGTLGGRDGAAAALAARVATAVRDRPVASVALAQLLRSGTGLDLADAVVQESFVYSTLQAGPEFARWLAARSPGGSPPPGSGPPVLVDRDGGTLRLTLNRPRTRNAVDRGVRDGLVEGLRLARADPAVTAVELRGAGPSFSSGGDLFEFGTLPDPARAHLIRTTRSPALALAACAAVTTAFVQGAAIGAGMELAAFAGRVVARPDAVFRLPELAMGLVPGAGGTASIPRRIGRRRTAFVALTGAPLDAATALRWGLVDEVVAD